MPLDMCALHAHGDPLPEQRAPIAIRGWGSCLSLTPSCGDVTALGDTVANLPTARFTAPRAFLVLVLVVMSDAPNCSSGFQTSNWGENHPTDARKA